MPRPSEQADNDDVTVTAVRLYTSENVPTESLEDSRKHVTRTLYLPDKQAQIERHRNKANNSTVNIGFSAAMKPSGYSECVSVTDGPPRKETSVATLCDFSIDARYKETVNIGPGLHPAWFQSRIVCHGTTSKKNYKTSIDYVPKMKPLKYGSTRYVRPKHLVTTYVSYMDYVANDNQKWYTTTMELLPGSNHVNTVHNFQMRQRVGSVSSDDDVISDMDNDDVANGNGEESDVAVNSLNEYITLKRFSQPPLLISSSPDADSDDKNRMSHRTKMVVKSAPPPHMNEEDYVVYLNGYASTGDVITKAHTFDGDVDNGYLSDDTTNV